MAENTPKAVIIYAEANGREPLTRWLQSLRDRRIQKRIEVRLLRLEQGQYGDCAPVGEEVLELRLFFGAGYRVYFGEDGDRIVVLLCGGDKSTQRNDIKRAKQYWKDYQKNA
ncbi:MAG: type II toxin-antitoxin system RelE/ParE family toxin [Cyanobacteria bacterium J06642_2]